MRVAEAKDLGYREDLRRLHAGAHRHGAGRRRERPLGWSTATFEKHFRALKRVLRETTLEKGLLKTACLQRKSPPKAFNKIIGERHGSFAAENEPVLKLLESWIETLRIETRNRSDVSLRSVMSFYLCQRLPKLGLRLEEWPGDPAALIRARFAACPELAREICGPAGPVAAKKAGWLNHLLNSILGAETPVPASSLRQRPRPQDAAAAQAADGSDVHRISAADLDKIYAQSAPCVLDKLLFMLMITTGLRVGAVTLVLTANIADVVDRRFVVRTQGRTREKGSKWASFMLTAPVRRLVHERLTKHRPAVDSPYLFPGVEPGGHLSTNAVRGRFARLCTAAGLKGRQFHPHALRHSYAHMLLDTGNPVEIVSKCLNHSSSGVTEAFYLKESAAEILNRANIPWLDAAAKKEAPKLPSFLNAAASASAENAATVTQTPLPKRRRTGSSRSSLEMFQTPSS